MYINVRASTLTRWALYDRELAPQCLSDGSRRMTSIQEITGMEGDVVAMQEIFKFQRETVSDDGKVIGEYISTGLRSSFADRFKQWGMDLPKDIFIPGRGPR